MTEHPAVQPDRRLGVGSMLLCVALLPVLYVLSVGPVVRFYSGTRGAPPRAVRAFYAPLEALYDNSDAARAFFDWYLRTLWRAK